MSGPIVRTGTTPKFWENWEKAFGKETKTSAKSGTKATAKKPAAKPAKKAVKRAGKK